ncbi:MAG: hypothetical protein HY660_17850 [Armatimonadetes bacterium]|nr:hypothetical protein [Armatimonadota bacterium]
MRWTIALVAMLALLGAGTHLFEVHVDHGAVLVVACLLLIGPFFLAWLGDARSASVRARNDDTKVMPGNVTWVLHRMFLPLTRPPTDLSLLQVFLH